MKAVIRALSCMLIVWNLSISLCAHAACVNSEPKDWTCMATSEGENEGNQRSMSPVSKINRDHMLLQRGHSPVLSEIDVDSIKGSMHLRDDETLENSSLVSVRADCDPSQVQRRRRADSMCSCRRRAGGSDLRSGLVCKNDKIVTCAGSDCPLGWPTTNEKSGGGWCEVNRPRSDWLPLKTCPTGSGTISVKVLAYNLFWWNLFGRRGGENGRAGRKIASTSAPEEYDLLGFQECDDIGRVMGDARKHGLSGDYGFVGPHRALAIAYRKSRWTVLDSGVSDVGEDSRRQYYGKRSAMWVRVQHRDGPTVFFVNHHGPLPVSESGGCTGSATAYNILKLIATNSFSGDAVMLLGDFNAQPHSSRIKALDKHIHRIMTGSSMGGVDHIFSNCDGSAVVSKSNIGSGGSDHDALNAVFAIPIPSTTGDPPATTASTTPLPPCVD